MPKNNIQVKENKETKTEQPKVAETTDEPKKKSKLHDLFNKK